MYAEGKINTDRWYPVVLLSDTDGKTPVNEIAFDDITAVEFQRLGDGASWLTCTVLTTDWHELSDGEYALRMGADEFTDIIGTGIYQVHVVVAGALTFRFPVEVRAHLLEENLDLIRNSTSYPNGFVYFDSSKSNDQSVLGVDGTPTNPVSDETAAKTLADELHLGTKKIMITGEFAAYENMSGYEFHSAPGGMARFIQDGKELINNRFYNLSISGTATFSIDNTNQLFNCIIEDNASISGRLFNCWIENHILAVNILKLYECYGDDVYIDCTGAAGETMDIYDLHCVNLSFSNMADTGLVNCHFTSGPSIAVQSTCADWGIFLTGIIRSIYLEPGSDIILEDLTIHLDKADRSFNTSQYIDGYSHYNEDSGVTNAEFGAHGMPNSPLGSVEAVYNMGYSLGTKKIMIRGDMTLDRNMDGFEFCGFPGGDNRLIVDGQSIVGCTFRNLNVSGEAFAVSDTNRYFDCQIQDGTNVAGMMQRCQLNQNVKIDGITWMHQCFSAEETLEFIMTGIESIVLSINDISCDSVKFTGVHSSSKVFANFNGSPDVEVDSASVGEVTLTGIVKTATIAPEAINVNDYTLKIYNTVDGNVNTNIKALNDDPASAIRLQKGIDATETGTVSSGTHTTTLVAASSLVGLTADAVKYRVINFTSGNNKGRSAPITGYTSLTGAITIDSDYALPSVPVNTDKFTVT